jgi:hypothetical protein
LIKERAGYLEKISQKFVGSPFIDQVGEIIENITTIFAMFFDYINIENAELSIG